MLTPTLVLDVGSARYEQASHLRLRRGLLPIVDRLELALPAATRFDGALGDEVGLELDGGEGSTKVFAGRLTAVQRGLRSLRLTAHGHALALARVRPAGAYEKLSVQAIVERLTEDLGLDLAIREADMPTALFVCEGRASALESIVRLCAMTGLQAAFDGEGTLRIGPEGPGEALALRCGRELVELTSTSGLVDERSFVVAGEGGGAPDSDQSLWIANDFFAGNATAAASEVCWRSEPLLRRVDDADTAAQAWTTAQRRREAPVRMTCWLVPEVAPGSTIDVEDLPDHLPLPTCVVRQVVHTIDPVRGGRSEIWANAEPSGGGLLP